MTTAESVESRFYVVSQRHGVEDLSALLPWRVVESDKPHGRVDFFVTVFDPGAGRHDRVDVHLEHATEEIIKQKGAIEQFSLECKYTLWLRLRSPAKEVFVDVPAYIVSRLAYLRIGLHVQISRQRLEAGSRRPSRRRPPPR
jgi:hypothetical protein